MPNTPTDKTVKIVVLSDGETFDLLDNSEILEVPESWNTEEIEHFLAQRS